MGTADIMGDRPLFWGAVSASGLIASVSPTVLQVLWLLVIGGLAAAGPRASRAIREARQQPGRPG